MVNLWVIRRLLLMAAPGLLWGSPLPAQEIGDYVIKTGHVEENLYLAGGRVHVLAEVEGDVVAAGGQVVVNRRVGGDVLAAGGSVEVRGEVLNDVRAAGGEVTVAGSVGGDALLAGGRVRLTATSTVGERAWLGGGDVEVAGRVGRELRVGAGSVSISGEIAGDVELAARQILILPTARIEGDLTYRSPEPARIDPAARITGAVIHVPVEPRKAIIRPARTVVSGLFLFSLLLAGVVLIGLFPGFSIAAARTIGSNPWKSLGLGLALLATTPVAASLLLATLVAIPLGLAALALYFVALLAGFLTGALFLGDLGARCLRQDIEPSTGWKIGALAIACIVLWLLQFIPLVGGLALFLVLLFGLGAWVLQAYRAYAAAHP